MSTVKGQPHAVYDEMLSQAWTHLINGRSVILDGTWRDAFHRDQARQLAAQTHSAGLELQCATSTDTAAQRVGTRTTNSFSDAPAQITHTLAKEAHEWPDAYRIDTSKPVSKSVHSAEKLWHLAV